MLLLLFTLLIYGLFGLDIGAYIGSVTKFCSTQNPFYLNMFSRTLYAFRMNIMLNYSISTSIKR